MNNFSSETHASFWEHVEELRRVLIHILLVILVGFAAAFLFYNQIFSLLNQPLSKLQTKQTLLKVPLRQERILNPGTNNLIYTVSHNASVIYYPETTQKVSERTFLIPPHSFLDLNSPVKNHELMILGPLEGFMITLKIAFWMGLVGTAPIWMLLLCRYISPALKTGERRLVIPFFALSLCFLFLGISFAFFITIPLANSYLHAFNSEIGTNLWSLASYMDYTVILLLSNGLAFQLSVVALFLVQLRVLKARSMAAKRRQMILAAFILGALLTPPDILTQFLLAVPLIALYELVILYARFLEFKGKSLSCVK